MYTETENRGNCVTQRVPPGWYLRFVFANRQASFWQMYGNRLKVQLTKNELNNKRTDIWLNCLSFGEKSTTCPMCNASYLQTLEITHWQNIRISHLKWQGTFDPESCKYIHDDLHINDQMQSLLWAKNSDVSHFVSPVTQLPHGQKTHASAVSGSFGWFLRVFLFLSRFKGKTNWIYTLLILTHWGMESKLGAYTRSVLHKCRYLLLANSFILLF